MIRCARGLAAAVAGWLFLLPAPCLAEADRPMEREGARIRALFDAGKFAELDAIELQSRDPGQAISDGQQLRAAFYDGLACGCLAANREEKLKAVLGLRDGTARWLAANPQSRAARLLVPISVVRHGYFFRGSGYARDVASQDMAAFREKVQEASLLLEAMGEDMKDEPEYYVTRLEVARYLPREEAGYASLMQGAMARHPRYQRIYFEGASYYSPRWGGSLAELKSFVEKAAEATKPWMGDAMYARLNWSEWKSDMFTSGQADWPRMKAAFEGIVADYPDSWNLNNFAKFACYAKDPGTLRPLMERLQGRVSMAAWNGMQTYSWCVRFLERNPAGKAP